MQYNVIRPQITNFVYLLLKKTYRVVVVFRRASLHLSAAALQLRHCWWTVCFLFAISFCKFEMAARIGTKIVLKVAEIGTRLPFTYFRGFWRKPQGT